MSFISVAITACASNNQVFAKHQHQHIVRFDNIVSSVGLPANGIYDAGVFHSLKPGLYLMFVTVATEAGHAHVGLYKNHDLYSTAYTSCSPSNDCQTGSAMMVASMVAGDKLEIKALNLFTVNHQHPSCLSLIKVK